MEKVEWSVAGTQKLIDLYEQYPCLFNTAHKLYHNKHARTDALHKISESLKESVPHATSEEVKKKITNMRSQYTHECAKRKKSSHSGIGEEELYEPSVWWFTRLNFLAPHVKPRKGKSSLDALESQQLETLEEDYDTASSSSTYTHTDEVAEHTTNAPTKKRKVMTAPVEDSVVSQTVQTLQQLQHALNEPQAQSVHHAFGDYIVTELNSIDDEDIITDMKYEISNILYQGKKQFIAKCKAGIVIEDISENNVSCDSQQNTQLRS